MQIFFIACAVFGGGVLLAQLVFGAAGLEHGHGPEVTDAHSLDAHGHAAEGLHLRSARALAAGLTFFGLGGLLGLQLGVGPIIATCVGVVFGAMAQLGTGYAIRAMTGFEQDRTLVLDRAIGQSAVVYLTVPAERSGLGKVHVSFQERFVEVPAITRHGAIPTGSSVLIVDVDEDHPGTLVVIPNPPLLEESDVQR